MKWMLVRIQRLSGHAGAFERGRCLAHQTSSWVRWGARAKGEKAYIHTHGKTQKGFWSKLTQPERSVAGGKSNWDTHFTRLWNRQPCLRDCYAREKEIERARVKAFPSPRHLETVKAWFTTSVLKEGQTHRHNNTHFHVSAVKRSV